jgi:hypothetical protein
MRYVAALLFGLGLLVCGCSSRDEVLRLTSPDGRVDALLFEKDCGAPCSFGYEVRLATKGSRHGEEVASLVGASRNDNAWGVNLKWSGADELSVEYLRAEDARLLKQTVGIAGHNVKVSLRGGIKDPLAPAGGMLYNLQGRPRD